MSANDSRLSVSPLSVSYCLSNGSEKASPVGLARYSSIRIASGLSVIVPRTEEAWKIFPCGLSLVTVTGGGGSLEHVLRVGLIKE